MMQCNFFYFEEWHNKSKKLQSTIHIWYSTKIALLFCHRSWKVHDLLNTHKWCPFDIMYKMEYIAVALLLLYTPETIEFGEIFQIKFNWSHTQQYRDPAMSPYNVASCIVAQMRSHLTSASFSYIFLIIIWYDFKCSNVHLFCGWSPLKCFMLECMRIVSVTQHSTRKKIEMQKKNAKKKQSTT